MSNKKDARLIWVKNPDHNLEEIEEETTQTLILFIETLTGPSSAVGSESNCRSRGRQFDPSLVKCFGEVWPWNNTYRHSSPSADSSERICIKFWLLFVCLFCCFTSRQQLWSWRDGQLTIPYFFLGKLEQAVNHYFVHILSFVTDNNPSWMIQRKGGEWP